MHGQPFELERGRARNLQFDPQLASREPLDRRTIRPSVSDTRVTRDGLDQRRETLRIPLEKLPFDATMLVPELDLEVMNLFSEAHEAERAGLDDTCVNRADCNLVNFLSLDPVEGMSVHRRLLFSFVANGFEPRMTADTNSGLLVKLSLEAVKRRQLRGQFVITELRRGDRSSDQNGACRVAECSGDPDLIAEAL